jgi:surfactin synthase thioesterase subunit
VCFPFAGGTASYFHPWGRALAPFLDVLAVQYPGRQDRIAEACLTDAGELAEAAVRELLPYAERPLALFGHSMGALLAFEAARRLRREGVDVPVLFVSGRRSPTRPAGQTGLWRDDTRLLAEVRRLNPPQVEALDAPELLPLIMPMLRGDYQAVENYRYEPAPPLTHPVTALTGDADPQVTPAEAEAWREHTTGAFDVRVFPGGHFFLGSAQDRVLETITSHPAITAHTGFRSRTAPAV